MKLTCKSLIVLISALLVVSSTAVAEDINSIFKKVNEYIAAENYSKAIEELSWANKELEKLHSKKLASLLPDEIQGYKGEKVETQSALGMNSLSRKYKKDGDQIELSISGSGKGGPTAGLAGLGKMAAAFGGNQPGVETFRVEGLTANLNTSGRRPELTVFMDSGSILSLQKKKKEDTAADTLKGFAKELQISTLDKYLKGEVPPKQTH